MSGLDEVEYWNLIGVIGDVEKLVVDAGYLQSSLLTNFLDNARKRLETLEESSDLGERRERKETELRQNAAVVLMVMRETNLSLAEREVYGSFLEKAFFTRDDFDGLEGFYTSAWDRLSELGKDEMSHRVWEGVRRGEYAFSDLPDIVRKKEADRLYEQLASKSLSANLAAIPAADRQEFIAAYRSGDREQADQILDRDVFRENVATEPSTTNKAAEPQVENLHSDELVQAAEKDRDEDQSSQITLRPADLPPPKRGSHTPPPIPQ